MKGSKYINTVLSPSPPKKKKEMKTIARAVLKYELDQGLHSRTKCSAKRRDDHRPGTFQLKDGRQGRSTSLKCYLLSLSLPYSIRLHEDLTVFQGREGGAGELIDNQG